MGKVLSVVSAVGGVGKSTFCCHFARTISVVNKKIAIVEFKFSPGSLDIFLSVDTVLYDICDVVDGVCDIDDALEDVPNFSNLKLLSSPSSFKFPENYRGLKETFLKLKLKFDIVILDISCEYIDFIFDYKIIDYCFIIVQLDDYCIRNSYILANFLDKYDGCIFKMVVNKVDARISKKNLLQILDYCIDEIGVKLIGVIPFSDVINSTTNSGSILSQNGVYWKIFNNIFRRICGNQVLLSDF